MAKSQSKKPTGLDQIELHPDAWQRFEKFVDTKVRTTPTPKPTVSRAKVATRKRKQKS